MFDEYRYYSATGTCITPAAYGLYSYLQIGRDPNYEDNSYSNLFGEYSDYLRYISADGFHDMDLDQANPQVNNCWLLPNGNGVYPFIKQSPNPLTGTCDLDDISVDFNTNNILEFHDKYPPMFEYYQGNYLYNVFEAGNTRQVFTQSGINKFGIGYNPSCASMIHWPGENVPISNPKTQRIVYLNGVSVEILNQTGGTIQVQIKFDDVDIVNDQSWCAPEIEVNQITTTGPSINIKSTHKITLDQGFSATKMNGPITFNGKTLFTDPTVMRCKANSFINLEANSELVVDNNSQLVLESNSRVGIDSGAILRIKRGGRLILNTNSVINCSDGKILIEDDGFVDYYPNSTVNLDGSNAIFEINGILNIQDNATFTFTYNNSQHGFIKFGNTSIFPSRNIFAGLNASFEITGSSSLRKVLEIEQETLYGPSSLNNFKIHNGSVLFNADSRLQCDGLNTVIEFTNVKFTSISPGSNNQHRGVHLYGQQNVNIHDCTFEYGKYGIFAFLTYGGAPLTVVNSVFRHNTYGIWANDKGLNTFLCSFFNNDFGVYAGHMSFPSDFYQGHFGGGALNSNDCGIRWQGAATPSLKLEDPYINSNNIGVRVDNCPLEIYCGTISYNDNGIIFNHGASLHMDDQVALPAAANVTVYGNNYSIHTVLGSYLYLYKGQNDLETSSPGNQNSAFGILVDPPYTIPVPNNWWSPSGLSNNEYNITDWNGNPYTLTGIDLSNTTLCGQAIPPCPNPPCNMDNPIENCPDCEIINTDDFQNIPLNEASKDALDIFLSNDPNRYTESINLFLQILNENLENPDEKELYILNYDYIKLMEALGFAYKSGQLSGETDESDNVVALQNYMIDKAINEEHYPHRFRYNLDKAQTLRISGKLNECRDALTEMLGWVEGSEDEATVNDFICIVAAEMEVLNGFIEPGEIENSVQSCNSGNSFRIRNERNIPERAKEQPDFDIAVSPHPATAFFEVHTNREKICIEVINGEGKTVYSGIHTYDAVINTKDLSKGMYWVKANSLMDDKGASQKISIQ